MIDEYLARLRRAPASGRSTRSPGGSRPGVTVLIPTYTPAGSDRTERLRLCVDSVLAVGREIPVVFLVVDNGLSAPAARRVGELLRACGREHHVLPAPTAMRGERYTAAHARNTGLAYLADLPATSPLRRQRLLFLDDDSALAPDALGRLSQELDAHSTAIAACPRVIAVPDLATWASDGPASLSGSRRLPGPWIARGYDLLSVTSHGSLVTGRTVGLLVRQDPVLRWVRDSGPLFFEGTPYGSTEDMLAMAVLSRLGELRSVPAAEVADEARGTPGATRAQQFAWGYDHAWLARALAEAGALDAGVHVLTWRDEAGWEHHEADWGPHSGFLINPAELRLGHGLLTTISANPTVAEQMFGGRARKLGPAVSLLGRVLDRWDATGGRTPAGRPRADLPPLRARNWASLRDGLDALVGHLAGNATGSLDSAPYFLYGARQPATHTTPPIDWSAAWPTASASLAPAS